MVDLNSVYRILRPGRTDSVSESGYGEETSTRPMPLERVVHGGVWLHRFLARQRRDTYQPGL